MNKDRVAYLLRQLADEFDTGPLARREPSPRPRRTPVVVPQDVKPSPAIQAKADAALRRLGYHVDSKRR